MQFYAFLSVLNFPGSNPELFSLNRFMTFEQRYVTVALLNHHSPIQKVKRNKSCKTNGLLYQLQI